MRQVSRTTCNWLFEKLPKITMHALHVMRHTQTPCEMYVFDGKHRSVFWILLACCVSHFTALVVFFSLLALVCFRTALSPST